MAAGNTLLELRNVDFSFNRENPVFADLSFRMGIESPVMILGSSGCGKTSLLSLIAGLLKPLSGEIVSRFLAPGMVFQEPRLLPWKTVAENVGLPLLRVNDKKAAREKALRYLEFVSLSDKADASPSELSGGQKQRANLARAFACPGDLLLMDEPFQSLDIPLRIELMDLTRTLLDVSARELNVGSFPALIVTHDPREAVYMGKRIIVLGSKPQGIILDEAIDLSTEDRAYGSVAQGQYERRILNLMRDSSIA